jgi:hypothetical protein
MGTAKMRFLGWTSLLLASVVALPVQQAAANVVVTMNETRADGRPPTDVKIYLEPDRMRVTPSQGGGGAIWRDDKKAFWVIDDKNKSYTEITPESMKAVRQGMDQMRQQMQEQLKAMPEAQRRQMEERMGQHLGQGGERERVSYVKTASGKSVGKWRCDEYEQRVGAAKRQELCVATLKELGLASDDVRALKSLYGSAGLGDMGGGRGTQPMDIEALWKAAGGEVLPVRVVDFDGDKKRSETVMKSVERTSIPPATFEVPAGYQKQEMGPGGRRGR